ncbi:MAG: spore cortex biosynthesis protein YabQ [Clostridia bacterium]|nr:spore cortex biosynthesis protein YabQ [Clostridia bacterium]
MVLHTNGDYKIFLISLAIGAFLGIVYDAFRILRAIFKCRNIVLPSLPCFNKIESKIAAFLPKERSEKRRFSKIASSVFLFVCDFVYMLIFTFSVFSIAYLYCDGRIRSFIIIGEILGFLIYDLTVGRFIITAFFCLLYAIDTLFSLLYNVFIKPIARKISHKADECFSELRTLLFSFLLCKRVIKIGKNNAKEDCDVAQKF